MVDNFCSALGLGRERYEAKDEEIKANHKVRTLLMHPDKCGIGNASEVRRCRLTPG